MFRFSTERQTRSTPQTAEGRIDIDLLASHVFQEFVIVIDIVILVIMFRGQDEADGTAGEIVEGAPRINVDKQSLPRMIEQYRLAFVAIVERHVKASAQGHDKLLQSLVGVASPTLTPRHVLDPIGALDVEWHHLLSLSKGQVATRVSNLWQVNEFNFHLR